MWRTKGIWSPVEVEWLKSHRDEPVLQLTIALAKSMNAIRVKLREIDGKPVKLSKGLKSRSRIGKRKDLGLFMRSGWEANVARAIKFRKISFLYEPKVFVFDKFKHGTVSYVPDFMLFNNPNPAGDMWLEVKGFLKSQDKTKLRRFKKFYPDEFAKMVAVCNPNTKAEAFFKEIGVPIYAYYKDLDKQYKAVIPEWE